MLEPIPEETENSVGDISESENVPNPVMKQVSPLNPEAPEYVPESSRLTHPSAELLKVGGRIKVPVKVNDKIVVKALIDSGAEPSCVTQSLADKLGIKPDTNTTFEVQGVGENNVQIGKEVSGIVIGLHGLRFKPNKFIVIEDANTDYDIVLGLNFLINNGVIIDPGERTIYHRKDGKIDWLIEVSKDERQSRVLKQDVDCTVVTDTRVTGKTFSSVPITWNSLRTNCDCITCEEKCEYFYESEFLSDFISCETFTGIINQDNPVILLKLDIEDQNMTLKSGQKLGNIHQLPLIPIEVEVNLQYSFLFLFTNVRTNLYNLFNLF